MATTAPISGTTITFDPSEMAALRALLYALQDKPTVERMNREYGMALGSNHIESITALSKSI